MLALRSLNAREHLGRFCAAFALAAQTRSHAGCALAGYPLALIGRRMFAVFQTGFAYRRLP
jgi:hypothetical protein